MKMDADLWNSLLTLSGGALEPTKCFWYAVIPDTDDIFCFQRQLIENGVSIALDDAMDPDTSHTLRSDGATHRHWDASKLPMAINRFRQRRFARNQKTLPESWLQQFCRERRLSLPVRQSSHLHCRIHWQLHGFHKQLAAIQVRTWASLQDSRASARTQAEHSIWPARIWRIWLTSLAASQTWLHTDLLHAPYTPKRQTFDFASNFDCLDPADSGNIPSNL